METDTQGPSTQATAGTKVKYKPLISMSNKKIKSNSAFISRYAGRRRSQTLLFGRKSIGSKRSSGYKLLNVNMLCQGINNATICAKCKHSKSKLELFEKSEKFGLGEKLFWQCNLCHNITEFQSSAKVFTDKVRRHRKAYDINIRSVYAATTVGIGRKGMQKICGIFDLPKPISSKPYNVLLKTLSEKSVGEAEAIMNNSATKLGSIMLAKYPDLVEVDENGKFIYKVSVTVDGTWQKRGHTSKVGVVFVIAVLTGEVLDYAVKSLVCHQCVSHKDNTSIEHDCSINHSGSSDQMETQGAKEIFLRSVEKRNMKYVEFVGDGDSGCFGSVKEACYEKYGDGYVVVKEECVGHVQKRMGTGLREYKRKMRGKKLSDGKTVGGVGRLTDKIIDKIQNFYGQAIRNNSGDKESMENDIWAIYMHMIHDDESSMENQHNKCPMGKESWCRYNVDLANGTNNYNDKSRLPSVFLTELKPLFTRLTNDELLNRCLMGHTQNQNESLNNVLWSICPKTKFCGVDKVKLCTSEAISHFNTGAASRATILETVGVTPGYNMLSALQEEDATRVYHSMRKVQTVTRIRRRKMRGEKKSGGKKSATTYLAGGFGLSKHPEINCDAPVDFEMTVVMEPCVTFINDNMPLIIQNFSAM